MTLYLNRKLICSNCEMENNTFELGIVPFELSCCAAKRSTKIFADLISHRQESATTQQEVDFTTSTILQTRRAKMFTGAMIISRLDLLNILQHGRIILRILWPVRLPYYALFRNN